MLVGVDVGGTNSDAVVLEDNRVVAWAKETTSADVTSGVREVIKKTFRKISQKTGKPFDPKRVKRISIGAFIVPKIMDPFIFD